MQCSFIATNFNGPQKCAAYNKPSINFIENALNSGSNNSGKMKNKMDNKHQ
jgi:hypothetical protein